MSEGPLVDADVLLDVMSADESWSEWSANALEAAADAGPLLINPIVYAEVSVRFGRIEDLDAALPPSDFVRAPLPWAARSVHRSPTSTSARTRPSAASVS